MADRVRHRKGGRPFARLKAQVLSVSDVCWLCGHPGSDTLDHVVPVSQGGPELDPRNVKPAHHEACPTCGVRCNMVRGARPVPRRRTSRQW